MRLWGRNLACVRGGREVFRGVDFSVDGGAALLVTGRNGAGKSTLLRLTAGLLRRADGELGLDGGDTDASIGEQAHYLGHQDALKPSLTVAENLSFWASFLGGAPGEGDALAAVGLASLKDLPAAYLSAGQKRRLSIARLLAVKRPIWLLDEPTSALDVKAQAQFADFMRAHLASGGAIMAAVHGSIGLDDARQLEIGGRA